MNQKKKLTKQAYTLRRSLSFTAALLLCFTLLVSLAGCKKDAGADMDTVPGTEDADPDENNRAEDSAGEDPADPDSSTSAGDDTSGSNNAFDLAAAEAAAAKAADSLRTGDYKAVAAQFDAAMSAAMSGEMLEQAWQEATANLGSYVGRVSVTSTETQGYFYVEVLEHYENNGLLVRLPYSADGLIAGLSYEYQAVSDSTPETSDAYTEEAITVSGDPKLPLDGLLTLPNGVQKPPVVILLQGSGSTDKDETIGAAANKPFADIAHGLAEEGIAVIRYDKRSYVYPETFQTPESLTIEKEYLEDVSAAISLAQGDSRLDGEHIFVLGHSLGGMLTPRIAYDHPELAGIISMAGSLRPLWEITYDQNIELAGTLRDTLSGNELNTLEAQMEQVESDIAVLRGDISGLADSDILLGIPAGYWKSLGENAGLNYIGQIDLPILVLQGDADFQVYPEKDYQLWVDTLTDRPDAACHLYQDLNHLMMPTSGKRDVSDYDAKAAVDAKVITDTAEFVKAQSED